MGIIKKFEEFINEDLRNENDFVDDYSRHRISDDDVFIILHKNDDYFQEVWGVYDRNNYKSEWENAKEEFNKAGMDDLNHLYLIGTVSDVYTYSNKDFVNKLMTSEKSPEKEDPDKDFFDVFDAYDVIDQLDGGEF